ncbi:MAG: alkylation response protein AidB-like acyl-CoA dehydrogenase [Oceanicoccus sp.]|jgi:alkylation response protein AidB-like acyl-CoA dehydrogenase
MSNVPNRYANTLYSDTWLPREAVDIRNQVRAFAEDHIRPVAHELNNTPESIEAFPRQLVAKMAKAGLFAIPYSAEYGGAGLKYPTLATMVMLEEIAYLSSGLAAAVIDVQLILFGQTLTNASSEVKSELFPKLIRGEIVGAFATSEPAASTDLSINALQTEATRVAGGYRINGQKRWITNSPVADYMFVLAKLEQGLTMLLVDMTASGINVGAPDKKMGNYCQLTADIIFDDVFVSSAFRVGEEGQGLKSALTSLTLGRVGIGACGVGMAQAAFDFSADYMKQREVFGQALSKFQHWQFTYADYAMQLESARNLYVKAALGSDEKRDGVQHLCAMAKLAGTKLAGDLARDAIQVCGGYGFVKELANDGRQFPLEAIYRDSKIGEIYEGANEIQKLLIARKIFGRP